MWSLKLRSEDMVGRYEDISFLSRNICNFAAKCMRVVAMGYPAAIFANACNSEMHHGRILILVSTPPFSDP